MVLEQLQFLVGAASITETLSTQGLPAQLGKGKMFRALEGLSWVEWYVPLSPSPPSRKVSVGDGGRSVFFRGVSRRSLTALLFRVNSWLLFFLVIFIGWEYVTRKEPELTHKDEEA